MTSIYLPFPPSTNNLFSGRQKRFKSVGYKKWLILAKNDFLVQKYNKGFKWKAHTGQVKIIISLKAPNTRKRDLDNLSKAVIDFLVDMEVIKGDDSRYVRELSLFWKDDMPFDCFVIVEDI